MKGTNHHKRVLRGRYRKRKQSMYDAAANMTVNPMGSGVISYDAENRVISAGGATYTYDGDGNRILKDVGGVKTAYFRFNGQVIAEYQSK